MKEEHLKELLDKYYSGETSLEEENILRDYFSGEEILPGYEAEKEIFSYYPDVAAAVEPDAGFEDRIRAAVDDEVKAGNHKSPVLRWYTLSGIAAGLVILIASYFILMHRPEMKDTYSDPHLAYAETMKVLYEVSVRLNRGTEALKPLEKARKTAELTFANVGKSTSEFRENLKPLTMISRISNAAKMNLNE